VCWLLLRCHRALFRQSLLLLRWHGGEGFASRELDGRGRWSGGQKGEIWGKLVGIRVVWMTGGAHALNPTWRARSAPRKGVNTGLPTVLLSPKQSRLFLGRAGVSVFIFV
jgi:hypothetical protein